uniref:DOCKER domain-containing protein n=1 Tax=Rhabditophanes sp. KR3021 TaxID=114890 RepID=A0AC35U236_9BILA
MQITMALSTLVSNCAAFGLWNINECDLKKSLSNLLAYLENDCSTSLESPTALSLISYTQQVKDLIFNLHMILSDTTKLKHHCDDFEFLLDLMYRIAKGYQNNPDLRLTWLLSMAGKNIENNNFTSAAMCLLHVSALLTEYLSMIDSDPYFKTGAALYSHLTDNILEESAVSDDVISPEEEGICESWYFSREGLKTILEQAATLMEKVQMFELASQVYQILVPILQKNKDFSKVALMHEKIAANLRKIEGIQTTKENVSDAWMSPISNTDKR